MITSHWRWVHEGVCPCSGCVPPSRVPAQPQREPLRYTAYGSKFVICGGMNAHCPGDCWILDTGSTILNIYLLYRSGWPLHTSLSHDVISHDTIPLVTRCNAVESLELQGPTPFQGTCTLSHKGQVGGATALHGNHCKSVHLEIFTCFKPEVVHMWLCIEVIQTMLCK